VGIVAPLVIGVTSHRNLANREIEGLRSGVRAFFLQLQQDFPGLPLVVLSPLAEGGDQLVAQEALVAGARLVAPFPMPCDEYVRDFSDPSARAQFESLRSKAQVIELPLLPGNTRADIAVRGAARNRQYAQAGVFTASHCHILLAIWDGRPSDALGGTAQIVRFHMDGIPPGLVERRHSRFVTLDTGDESLLYHIACSRTDGQGGIQGPIPPLQPLQSRWVTDQGVSASDAGIPREFRRMFMNMQQFNADAERYADEFGASSAESPRIAATETLFAVADRLAIHFQKRVLSAMRGLYALAVLMGFAFVCYSDLPSGVPYMDDAIYVFVVLFAAGVWLAWLAQRREWHRKYIDYRALAEGLRVQGYWQRAGIGADESGAFAHDNFMQKQDVELGWIRNVMRAAAVRASITPPRRDVAAVVAEWIGEEEGEGQLAYYARKVTQRTRAHRDTQLLAQTLLGIVIAASVFLAAFHPWLEPDTTSAVVALMGVLAIVAAARESYAYRKADKELIKQYQYMCGIFASARRQLDAAQDPDVQRDILHALGDAALAEHAEWALMHRERPPEHGKL
jgi:hypothetical protein